MPREPNILDPFVRPFGDWQIGTDVKIPYLTITGRERKKKGLYIRCGHVVRDFESEAKTR